MGMPFGSRGRFGEGNCTRDLPLRSRGSRHRDCRPLHRLVWPSAFVLLSSGAACGQRRPAAHRRRGEGADRAARDRRRGDRPGVRRSRGAARPGRAKLKLKQADVKAQTDRVAKLKFQVGQVALAQFQNRNLDTAAQLFVTPDTEGFLSQISTVEKVSENQNSALQDYQQQQAALADLELSAEADLAALAEQEKQLKSLRAASKKKIAESKSVLAKLSAEEQRRIADEERRARSAAQRDAEDAEDVRGPRRAATRTTTSPRWPHRAAVGARRRWPSPRRQLGKPYRYAASGPNAYDCSGLTGAAWRSVGVSLPRSSSAQYSVGRSVARSDLRLGDLVFFYSPDQPRRALRRQRHDHPCAAPGQVGRVHQDELHAVRGCPPARLTLTCSTAEASRPFCAVAAALLLGCSARAAGPRTRAQSRPTGSARRAAPWTSWRPRSLAADRAGFDRLVSLRDPTFESRARLLFTNLTTLRLTELDFLVEPDERPLGPDRQRGAGSGRLGAARGGRHPPAGRGRHGRAPGLAHLRDRWRASEAGRNVRRARRSDRAAAAAGGSVRSPSPSTTRRPWWPGAGSRQTLWADLAGPVRGDRPLGPADRAGGRTGAAGSASRSRPPSGTSRRCSASRSSATRGSPR